MDRTAHTIYACVLTAMFTASVVSLLWLRDHVKLDTARAEAEAEAYNFRELMGGGWAEGLQEARENGRKCDALRAALLDQAAHQAGVGGPER